MRQMRTMSLSLASLCVLCGLAAAVQGCRHKEEAQPPPSVEELTQQMRSTDNNSRYVAVDQLGKLPTENTDAIPLLITALSDKDPDIRWVATKGLERYGVAAAAATPMLTRALSDSSPTVRAGAARALSTMGTAGLKALSALNIAANDRDEGVREEAKRAIMTIRQVQQFQSTKPKSSN